MYKRGARCPENTVCESVDNGEDLTINLCVEQQAPGKTAARSSRKDPQIGSSSNFKAPADIGGTQLDFSIKILDSMKASVSAFIMSKFFLQITLF
jgi:hypothetical protein